MMKCKYCGGNLTLEQAYCPHCGRPNEEAAQHVKDMEHYKSNFEDTKSDVYEVAEKKYGDHVTYDNHHSAGDPVCGGVCSICT